MIRGHALSWPRGEVTAIVGLTAFVLIAFNGLIDKPQEGVEISLSFGYWLALLASIGIFVSGGFRAVESGGGRPAKTARHVLGLRPRSRADAVAARPTNT